MLRGLCGRDRIESLMGLGRRLAVVAALAMAAAPMLTTGRAGAQQSSSAVEFETPVVYYIELVGRVGREIAAKPLRDMLDDAARLDADYIIIKLDNTDWEFTDAGNAEFDVYSFAEEIEPVITTEIRQIFEEVPEVVFWVFNAKGGACLVPFTGDQIFFHPGGEMGGIGSLESLLDGVGDEVVRQKQRSLRLARAQGIAIKGGYDYRLVNALAIRSYVLSYRRDGGRIELVVGYDENDGGLTLLTDDGNRRNGNEDTAEDVARGRSNDVLMLRERDARLLGVSEGTAEDLDELLTQLGIYRNYQMANGRSEQITRSWRRQLSSAERRIIEIYRELQGEDRGRRDDDPRKAIGRQIRLYEELLGMHNRFGDAVNSLDVQMTSRPDLQLLIEQARLQLLGIVDN
ncbi:MAG: hypothetical protein AAFR38_14370 [Planctomycetota bacterium]